MAVSSATNTMKLVRRLVLCLALVATQAAAGPYEDGVAAHDRGEYGAAVTLWRPLAEQGHRSAQFNVGVLYEKGLGVGQDFAEAARWYLKAAEQGDQEAQYNVAALYESGTGFPADFDQARKWYVAAIANRGTDAGSAAIRQRARERLAALPAAKEDVFPYDAGRFVVAHSDTQSCVIALQGTITRDTALKFDKVVQKTKQLGCDAPWLLLESPGGDLLESLALGKDVHFSHFRTVTRYECASGCALIFIAGSERVLMGSRAKIGFHQAATMSSNAARNDRHCSGSFDSNGVREMKRYVNWVMPERADKVIALIMATSCDAIEWTAGQRAIDLGIATSLVTEGIDIFGAKSSRAPTRQSFPTKP